MGLLDGINLNSSGGGGGLLDNLLQTLQYNTSAPTEPERRMMTLVGGARPDANADTQGNSMGLSMPQPGPAAFSDGAPGIVGLQSPQSATNMMPFAPGLNLGNPQAAPIFAPRAIASDQPQYVSPTIAPPDPREGQPLTDAERQMMALARPAVAQPQVAPAAPAGVAPAAVAASDAADPIAVGRYKMPRIGAADDFEPGDAAVPAAAKPAQGTLPAAAAPEAPSFNPLSGAFRGLVANAPAGPLGMLFGGIAGAAGMGAGSPAQQQAAVANLTAKALLAKGVEPAVVAAAVAPGSSPDLLKTLIAQHFGPDKFQHVLVKNPDGSESERAFDPSTGKYIGATAPAPSKYSVDPSLTGKDRLEALRAVDPLYARKIESMVNGDFPMPTGVAALRPESKRMIEDALAVDGATSASDFQTRASTRKDYASGVASRVTKSINTTIGHFATLDNSVDKLGNYTYFPHVANAVHDLVASNTDPAYQVAKSKFEANKEAAVKELDFALSGGHSSVSGSAELRDMFNRADSPGALRAAITEAMSLLQKRLESHTKAFTEGTKSQRDAQDFIYPENRQAFSKLLGEPDTSAPPSAAPAASQPAPKPGAYIWSPDKGLAAK